MYSYIQYSDQASINYYDVITIKATMVKVLQSSVHKHGVCVQYTECALSFYNFLAQGLGYVYYVVIVCMVYIASII